MFVRAARRAHGPGMHRAVLVVTHSTGRETAANPSPHNTAFRFRSPGRMI